MAYTAKTEKELRTEAGSLTKKLATELALIDSALAGTDLTLVDGKMWLGSAANLAAQQTMTGDVTITRSGETTCRPKVPLVLSDIVHAGALTGLVQLGLTASMIAINTANQMGIAVFLSTSATSGTTYGEYIRLNAAGAGVEAIAGRHKVLLTAAGIGNAHGHHATLELDTSAGAVTGLGTGLRGNLVVADRAVAAGTYYGMMAEIYALGNSAALPAASNACLGINLQPGTAMDLVGNAISFSGTDGTGKMIYTNADSDAAAGSIRILVNGAAKYLRFYAAEA